MESRRTTGQKFEVRRCTSRYNRRRCKYLKSKGFTPKFRITMGTKQHFRFTGRSEPHFFFFLHHIVISSRQDLVVTNMRLTSNIALAIIVASFGSVIKADTSGCLLSQTQSPFLTLFISSSFLIASDATCTRGVATSSGQPNRLVSATSSGSASSSSSSSDPTSIQYPTISTSESSHKSDSSSSSHSSSPPTSVGIISASSTGTQNPSQTSGSAGPVSSSSSAKRAGFTWDLGLLGMGLGMVMVI
jgi:hypothetical protein